MLLGAAGKGLLEDANSALGLASEEVATGRLSDTDEAEASELFEAANFGVGEGAAVFDPHDTHATITNAATRGRAPRARKPFALTNESDDRAPWRFGSN